MTTEATPGALGSNDQLGPLPEPYTRQWINAPFTERLLFTEDQMRALRLLRGASTSQPSALPLAGARRA